MRLDSQAITILILLLAVIYMGLLERVLERMRLTGRQAMFILLAIILGGSLPVLPVFKGLKINAGGMLVPLAVVVYLIATADERAEKIRSLFTILVTVIVVWAFDRLLPLEPGMFFPDLDPLYLPAVVAAVVAYGLGRSGGLPLSGLLWGSAGRFPGLDRKPRPRLCRYYCSTRRGRGFRGGAPLRGAGCFAGGDCRRNKGKISKGLNLN